MNIGDVKAMSYFPYESLNICHEWERNVQVDFFFNKTINIIDPVVLSTRKTKFNEYIGGAAYIIVWCYSNRGFLSNQPGGARFCFFAGN